MINDKGEDTMGENERILDFEQLLQSGIHYEDRKKLEHSVFSDIYKRGIKDVERIGR